MIINILGCGWLGIPLAEHLIGQEHIVKGSTTSLDKLPLLRLKGIQPFLVELNPQLKNPNKMAPFWQADVLVLNIPPGRGNNHVIDYHTNQIRAVLNAVEDSPIKFIVFISSTSVYPACPGTVAENDTVPGKADRDSGNALLKAEEMLLNAKTFKTTVLRFGGLYGGERHPARYLAGRKNVDKGEAPVNLIHREDCIAIITQLIEKHIKGEVFNAVSDGHPTRQQYYTKAAKGMGLEPPTFLNEAEHKNYKIVSNKKLKDMLSYNFIHPDPLLALP